MGNLPKLTATENDIRELEKLAYAEVKNEISIRAKAILKIIDGKTNKQVAKEMGCKAHTIGMWRSRYYAEGIEGLRDRPRSGRPKKKQQTNKKNRNMDKKCNTKKKSSKKEKKPPKDNEKMTRDNQLEIYNIVNNILNKPNNVINNSIYSQKCEEKESSFSCIYIGSNECFLVLEEETVLNLVGKGQIVTTFTSKNKEFYPESTDYCGLPVALNLSKRMMNILPNKSSVDVVSLTQSIANSLDKNKKYNIITYNIKGFESIENENIRVINTCNERNLYIFIEAVLKLSNFNFQNFPELIIKNIKTISDENVLFWYNGDVNFNHFNNLIVVKASIISNKGRECVCTTKNSTVLNALPSISVNDYNNIAAFENLIGNVYDGISSVVTDVNKKLFESYFSDSTEDFVVSKSINKGIYSCEVETFMGRCLIKIPYEIKRLLNFNERLWDYRLLYVIMKQIAKESYRNAADTINAFLQRGNEEKILFRNLQYKCKKFGAFIENEISNWTRYILCESGVDFDSGEIKDENKLKNALNQQLIDFEDISTLENMISNYNSKVDNVNFKINGDEIKKDKRVKSIYTRDNYISLSVDQVGVKKQKEKRKSENNSNLNNQQKTIQTSVIHIQSGNDVYRIAMDSLEKAFYVSLAIIIKYNLLNKKYLLIFTDGAKNISELAKEVFKCCKFEILLDWFHVKKRCYQLFSMALKSGKKYKKEKDIIRNYFLKMIFIGNLNIALEYLNKIDTTLIKSQEMIDEIANYIEKKKPYLYCYAIRKLLKVINSSNRVEKLNDLLVSFRCKHKAMSWSIYGLKGIVYLRLLMLSKEFSWFPKNTKAIVNKI